MHHHSSVRAKVKICTCGNARHFWSSDLEGGVASKLSSSLGMDIFCPNENLHLPAPNMFIPTDLLLKDTGTQEKVKFPVLVRKSSYASLWYKPDTRFSTPKAYVKIDFNCPFAKSSLEAEVLTVIFTLLLEDYLNEYGK
ncbi:hypothetical protein GH714_033722 [Hevea brasiliensis]|uniref:Peptidase M16 middle/third domain-containing protein n=1 Tax=Hevea brasiliensis TaxID=3981 RepID=A0A6A6M2Q7_HEVBR|nr:hypothetical protein GH714_033722 [Hevea brasiliensis]